NGRVWSLIIDRVRPGVRIFKDAEGLTYDPVINFTVELTDAQIETARAAEEIILIKKARTTVDLRRPHVDAQLRASGVNVELIGGAVTKSAFQRNRRSHVSIGVPDILRVVRDIDARFGVELDQYRCVRNRNEAAVFRIECQVVRPWRCFLLI